MCEEVGQVCTGCTACDFGAADTGGGDGAADSVDCVVVQFVEILDGGVPVGDVGFVPDLPVPAVHLG